MIQGHTLHVLLGPEYQGGQWFGYWLYLRGLTSCAFLMLAGFSFSVATIRHWDDYRVASSRLRHRLIRFGVLLLLGYAMRIPIRPLTDIGRVTSQQWQAFTAVDILQLVAVTLAALQALACFAPTSARLQRLAFGAAAGVVLLTPLAWRLNTHPVLPVVLSAYLSTATGSLFPLFPWAAYILFGAGLGAWFVRHAEGGGRRVDRVFALTGAGMFAAGVLLHQVPIGPYGEIEFWTVSPNLFLIKAGSVLVLLSAAVRATAARRALPRAVTVLSRESLTVYLLHVCILYGSIWNLGLVQIVGPHLDLIATGAWVGLLLASMSLVAWLWHECKVRSSGFSALVRATVAGVLLYAIV